MPPAVINNLTRDEQWTLSQTGNAVLAQRDLDGDQNYNEANEFDDDRGYNDVNELRTRDVDGAPGTTTDNYEPNYDKNGNLTDDDKRTPTGTYTFGYTYEFDAWNRLKEVRKQNGDLVAEYTYNGEGHRASWHYDANASGVADGSDPTYFFAYTEEWKLIGSYRGTDSDPKEMFLYHAAGANGSGDSSYIDHVLRRYLDNSNGWTGEADGAHELAFDYCHSWRPDVVAVLNASTGTPYEWAKYMSYGEPFGLSIGDANGTGTVNVTDQSVMSGWYTGSSYDVRVDFDGDNDLDLTDFSLFNGSNMGLGVLSRSSVGNRFGYAGYVHDPGLASTYYHVRNRVLNSRTQRWQQRDPEGYVDGMNLYAYLAAKPISGVDPMGLASACLSFDSCGQPGGPVEPEPDPCPVGGCLDPEIEDEYCCDIACNTIPPGTEAPLGRTICCFGRPVSCICRNNSPNPTGDPFIAQVIACAERCEPGHQPNIDCSQAPDPVTMPPNLPWRDPACGGVCSECGVIGCWVSCMDEFGCENAHDPVQCETVKEGYRDLRDARCFACDLCRLLHAND